MSEARCELCREPLLLEHVMDHLRLYHPVEYGDGPAMWPDGEVVIVDTTLDPTDFKGES